MRNDKVSDTRAVRLFEEFASQDEMAGRMLQIAEASVSDKKKLFLESMLLHNRTSAGGVFSTSNA